MGEKEELMGMGLAKKVSLIGNAFTILKHKYLTYMFVCFSAVFLLFYKV